MVENKPDVWIDQRSASDPVRVQVENFPATEPSQTVTAWSASDSQHLEETHKTLVSIGVLVAFSAGVLLIFHVPKVA